MFYQCPQCKKTWQFPVGKCADCFVDIVPMSSKTIKVIEVCESTIPTLVHPKVPYYVLLLEDEHGNKWSHKSVKKYSVGDLFETPSIADKNSVALWTHRYDINETVSKINDLLGGINPSGKKVLILPTLLTADHPYLRVNIFPETLEAVIKLLAANGAGEIKVGGQSFTELSLETMAAKSQIADVCQRNNVSFIDLSKEKFVPKGDIEISQLAYDSDLVINLAIMKMGEVSATRNLAVLIQKDSLFETIRMKGEEGLMKEAIKELPEILTIADAVEILDTSRVCRYFNLFLAGYNSLNVDRIFYEATNQKYPPPILSAISVETIKTAGRQVEEIKYKPIY